MVWECLSYLYGPWTITDGQRNYKNEPILEEEKEGGCTRLGQKTKGMQWQREIWMMMLKKTSNVF